MGPVSIGVEVQRNTDGDTPSSKGVFVTRTYLCDVRISKNDPRLKNGVWADSNQRNLDRNHQHSVYKLCLIQCFITVDIYIYMYSQTLSYK